MKKHRSFEVKKDTIKFFYEVDSYWNQYKNNKKSGLIKKIKPLYKGFFSFFIRSHRKFFLYRNIKQFFSYKLIHHFISDSDYINLMKKDYYKLFYDTLCNYYFNVLDRHDIIIIHSKFKNTNYSLLDDTYNKCIG